MNEPLLIPSAPRQKEIVEAYKTYLLACVEVLDDFNLTPEQAKAIAVDLWRIGKTLG